MTRLTPDDIGKLVKLTRESLGVTQTELARISGTGVRFIVDLERGKQTCHLGKVLDVLHILGIRISLTPPATQEKA